MTESEPAVRLAQPRHAVLDVFRGSLVGLAVGDALGSTVEFEKPGCAVPKNLVGGGPFRLKAGEWTDDTSQALCLAESLIARRAFDPADAMGRLYRWMTVGHLSVNGKCFDIGPSTSASLRAFAATGDPYQGRPDRDTNGAIMRLAPVPLALAGHPKEALRAAEDSVRMTHGGRHAIAAGRYLAGMIVGAIGGDDPFTPNGDDGLYCPVGVHRPAFVLTLTEEVKASARGHHPYPRGGFEALECFDAALWAVRGAKDFESAVSRAVGLGLDADTTGAVAGQLAGAIWGHHAIPGRWLNKLAWHDRIVGVAEALFEMSGVPVS